MLESLQNISWNRHGKIFNDTSWPAFRRLKARIDICIDYHTKSIFWTVVFWKLTPNGQNVWYWVSQKQILLEHIVANKRELVKMARTRHVIYRFFLVRFIPWGLSTTSHKEALRQPPLFSVVVAQESPILAFGETWRTWSLSHWHATINTAVYQHFNSVYFYQLWWTQLSLCQ